MWTAGPTAALSLAVAAFATLFGGALAVRARGRGFHAAIGACLALSGMAHTVGALGLRHALPDTFLLCLGLVIQLLEPVGLFWVSAVVLGAPGSAPRTRARLRAALVLVVCGISAGLAWTSTTLEVGLLPTGAPLVALGPSAASSSARTSFCSPWGSPSSKRSCARPRIPCATASSSCCPLSPCPRSTRSTSRARSCSWAALRSTGAFKSCS